MLRLGIEYDFLPRESEILHLKFWDLAFEQNESQQAFSTSRPKAKTKAAGSCPRGRPRQTVQNQDGPKGIDEDAKVIVRSNGTVTYVGKDIAYHLWKFGLLGKRLRLQAVLRPTPITSAGSRPNPAKPAHPHFGGASAIYNVIDSRQSDPQANVIQALRGMGYTDQADQYTHFSYEMVALTPRCAPTSATYYLRRRPRPPLHRNHRAQGLRRKSRRPDRPDSSPQRRQVAQRHPESARRERRNEPATKIAVRCAAIFHAQVHTKFRHCL